jgi:hypothetical protein
MRIAAAAALTAAAASALPPVTPGASLSPPEGDLAEQVLSEGRARLEEWRTFVAKQKLEASRTATRWYDQSSCDGEDRTHFLGIFGAAAQCAPAAVEQGCELFMFSEAYTSWGCYCCQRRTGDHPDWALYSTSSEPAPSPVPVGALEHQLDASPAAAPAPRLVPSPSPVGVVRLRARTDAIDAKPGWFRRKLSAVIYPDATRVDFAEASAPAAYYDKDCGRWILPDTDRKDEHATAASPPRAPPPSASMCPPGLAPAHQYSPPLPPPRRAASTSAMTADPLTAMMAPPPMRAMPSARHVGDAMTIRAPQSQSTPSFATFA